MVLRAPAAAADEAEKEKEKDSNWRSAEEEEERSSLLSTYVCTQQLRQLAWRGGNKRERGSLISLS
jgi:hypothetical protein